MKGLLSNSALNPPRTLASRRLQRAAIARAARRARGLALRYAARKAPDVSVLRIASPLIALALSVSTSTANEPFNMGPLAMIDELSIQDVMIGQSLTMENVPVLFQGNPSAAKAFESDLTTQVAARLKAAGLRVNVSSNAQIGFSLFGGKLSECDKKNFFMLEVWVLPPGASQLERERTVLGVASDAELSSAVIRAALSVIDDFIIERAVFRKAQRPQRAP